MTPEQAKELLPIITAFANSETVQCSQLTTGWWTDHKLNESTPSFFSDRYEWRIKPKEPREFWLVIYPQESGLKGGAYETLEEARKYNANDEIIHVKEITQ